MTKPIAPSELILTPEGRVYHLNLLPEELASTVITVGDPERVASVSRHFDHIEIKQHHREFVTHTGTLGKRRLSVVSTGIGTDNVDITLTELDALANIDFETRTVKPELQSLDIIRIGTSGSLQPDLAVDAVTVTTHALGFDHLLDFYQYQPTQFEQQLGQAAGEHFSELPQAPYVIGGNSPWIERFVCQFTGGMTATCCGFYGPQGRLVRAPLRQPNLVTKMQSFHFQQHRINNFEMETAGLYGLSKLLGHRCCSLSLIVANRIKQQFSARVEQGLTGLITRVLDELV